MLLPFAEEQLKKHREFYPFAAVIRADDSVELTGVYDENEHPASADVLETLKQAHREKAMGGEIKTSGIVWNAILNEGGKPTDGMIVVSLEHKDAYSVAIIVPYRIGLLKHIRFGDLYATEGHHDIFS